MASSARFLFARGTRAVPSRVPFLGRVPARGIVTSMNNVEAKQTIRRDGKFYTVLNIVSQSQGRGGATLKARIEELSSGKILSDVSFRPNENVEVVEPIQRTASLLYSTRDSVHLIDPEAGEELEVPMRSFVGGEAAIAFYDETTPITLLVVEDNVIRAQGPQFVTATIKNLDESKGSSGSDHRQQTRNAVLASGASVVVPTFLKVGDQIRVSVLERTFISRV
ncbi:hypothetical protein DFJ74DRAFT_676408 [Hyaloraphidium curvatum]|nr:hypothetical protein DFJ74DRAFT_676408 [Hyaloraphidium curvatum]